jgi:hypothetical protein
MEPDEQIPDEEIRARAHDIWDRHHRPEGYDLQFWLMAERELKMERRGRPKQEAESTADDAGSPATVNTTATEEPTQ